jgi:hypothetical protein
MGAWVDRGVNWALVLFAVFAIAFVVLAVFRG